MEARGEVRSSYPRWRFAHDKLFRHSSYKRTREDRFTLTQWMRQGIITIAAVAGVMFGGFTLGRNMADMATRPKVRDDDISLLAAAPLSAVHEESTLFLQSLLNDYENAGGRNETAQ